MNSALEQRDPSPLSHRVKPEGRLSPADMLPISATADIGMGEEGAGSTVHSPDCEPGATMEDKAQVPKPPSPLAGEGKGEGSHGSPRKRLHNFAKAMRKEPTDAERALWRIVRGKRLEGFKFKRQHPLGRFIADMICLEKRLVVEADGGQHHESESDASRDAWLLAQGFRTLRFWNYDILRKPQMVEDTILRELQAFEVQRDPFPTTETLTTKATP